MPKKRFWVTCDVIVPLEGIHSSPIFPHSKQNRPPGSQAMQWLEPSCNYCWPGSVEVGWFPGPAIQHSSGSVTLSCRHSVFCAVCLIIWPNLGMFAHHWGTKHVLFGRIGHIFIDTAVWRMNEGIAGTKFRAWKDANTFSLCFLLCQEKFIEVPLPWPGSFLMAEILLLFYPSFSWHVSFTSQGGTGFEPYHSLWDDP